MRREIVLSFLGMRITHYAKPMSGIPLLVCVLSVMIAGGCGRSGIERVVVAGKVTYQGRLIELGQIRFVPTKGTEAPVSGADIINGEYSVDFKGGVPVGTHLVKIEAYRSETRAPRGPVPPGVRAEPLTVKTQFLPKKFNTRTEFELTINSGSGKITKDFDLTD